MAVLVKTMNDSMRQLLDSQADRIEATLTLHKVPGGVLGASVHPRFVQFKLVPSPTVKLNRYVALSDEIAMALSCPRVRVYREGRFITIEAARSEPDPVRLVDMCKSLEGRIPPITSLLGLDETGVPLLLNLKSHAVVHVLLVGTTGSGKTALARTLLTSLALFNSPDDLHILLIDPKKGRGLGLLERLPHVRGEVAKDAGEAVSRLLTVVAEMERRDELRISHPALIVAVDELADLIQTGGREVEGALSRLAQRGRESGIHLVCCTQQPSAALIGSSMRANLPVRLVGKVSSRDEARYASGISDSQAEHLSGSGDFLLVTSGSALRFQAAWLGKSEFEQLCDRIDMERGTAGFDIELAPPRALLATSGIQGRWSRKE